MADYIRYMKNARRDAATVDTGGGAEAPAPDNGQDATEVDAAHASNVSGLPVELDAEAIKRLEAELDEARDQHLRLAAEFDNYRKRVTRERGELTDKAQASLVAPAPRRAR